MFKSQAVGGDLPAEQGIVLPAFESDDTIEYPIGEGATFGTLMEAAGIGFLEASRIYEAARPVWDLAKIRAGRSFFIRYDRATNEPVRLLYYIDTESELIAEKILAPADEGNENGAAFTVMASSWRAEVRPIPYEKIMRVSGGTVESSMYQAALDNNIDIRAIIELANAFQWAIDFAMDPRAGDDFSFVHEERYLDGEYVMPGRILAGRYNNAGAVHEVYYFEEDENNRGYFDPDGNSAQRMFLRAPLEYKYISSGFTTGLRYIQAFNISTGHRAIDYAAPAGTPIRAVGDGRVTFAGWDGSYGNKISIRHNATYQTNYAHLSRFAVRSGASVKQGDIIGYVGSTGLSTGPHLHYEMVKDGVKINPLKEVLPPGEPIKEENKERFFAEIAKWRELLP